MWVFCWRACCYVLRFSETYSVGSINIQSRRIAFWGRKVKHYSEERWREGRRLERGRGRWKSVVGVVAYHNWRPGSVGQPRPGLMRYWRSIQSGWRRFSARAIAYDGQCVMAYSATSPVIRLKSVWVSDGYTRFTTPHWSTPPPSATSSTQCM